MSTENDKSEYIQERHNQIKKILHRFDVSDSELKKQRDDLSKFNLNEVDNDGWSPLMTEILNQDYNAAELLLEHGVDTEIENSYGETALFLAIETQFLHFVELVSMYANINYVNKHGDNATALAEYYASSTIGDDKIVTFLKSNGGVPTPKETFQSEIDRRAYESGYDYCGKCQGTCRIFHT